VLGHDGGSTRAINNGEMMPSVAVETAVRKIFENNAQEYKEAHEKGC